MTGAVAQRTKGRIDRGTSGPNAAPDERCRCPVRDGRPPRGISLLQAPRPDTSRRPEATPGREGPPVTDRVNDAPLPASRAETDVAANSEPALLTPFRRIPTRHRDGDGRIRTGTAILHLSKLVCNTMFFAVAKAGERHRPRRERLEIDAARLQIYDRYESANTGFGNSM